MPYFLSHYPDTQELTLLFARQAPQGLAAPAPQEPSHLQKAHNQKLLRSPSCRSALSGPPILFPPFRTPYGALLSRLHVRYRLGKAIGQVRSRVWQAAQKILSHTFPACIPRKSVRHFSSCQHQRSSAQWENNQIEIRMVIALYLSALCLKAQTASLHFPSLFFAFGPFLTLTV